ncbi:MAG: alpha/beta fold hydrolase [Hellea sp.]|nr:alpha/beta fold hydrolase [Hellea sp.]
MQPDPQRKKYLLRDGEMSAVHFGFVSNPIKLVMLNANGFNAYSYKSILTPLGFHAVALDMRGHGMSNLPINIDTLKNWNIFRDDVVEFFDRYIKSPVILAGHSYGAVTGILAMPEIKNKVSGFVGFDPVLLRWPIRYLSHFSWFRDITKQKLAIARHAGRRKFEFDSFETAYNRYKERGAFRNFSDDALLDYLTGGLIPNGKGFKLSCEPLTEQAIFVAQAHNVFKSIKYLPKNNSNVIFAGKGGSVSFKSGRHAFKRELGQPSVSFDLNLDHMFPINKPEFAIDNLRKALSRAALNF